MKRIKVISNKSGFTIVELLIATAVMSVVLMMVSLTVLEISKLYYKGIISSRTQDAARNLLEGISRPIQFENTIVTQYPTNPYGFEVICVGTSRYTYAINLRNNPDVSNTENIRHAVWRDTVVSPLACDQNPVDLTSNLSGGKDMLADGMRILALNASPDGSDGLWSIEVTVMYGDRELMSPDDQTIPPDNCKGDIAGSQWCARASYKTKVFKRISDSEV